MSDFEPDLFFPSRKQIVAALASESYPELEEILEKRPPLEAAVPSNMPSMMSLSSRKTAEAETGRWGNKGGETWQYTKNEDGTWKSRYGNRGRSGVHEPGSREHSNLEKAVEIGALTKWASTIIQYTNPKKRPQGDWQCVVCGNKYDEADEARSCAEKDHAAKTGALDEDARWHSHYNDAADRFFPGSNGILSSEEDDRCIQEANERLADDIADNQHTASWTEVQQKAHDIFKIDGVRIIASDQDHVAAHVLGDHGTYESEIQYVPGTKSPAMWNCFLPDAPIMMADGTEKPISEIQVGDQVITHLGNSRPVVRIEPKHTNEDLVSIQFAGDPRPVVSTLNHELWVMHPTGNKMEWLAAHEIQVGDRVSFSVLADEVPVQVSCEHPTKPLIQTIKLDESLSYLVGWYLAEGFLVRREGAYRVGFALHKDETWVCDRLDDICQRYFGVVGTRRVVGNALDYRVSHWALYQLLDQLVGSGSKTKMLNGGLLTLPLEEQERLMQGWIEGDGHVQESGRTTLASANIPLLRQGREILARLGWAASLKVGTNPGGPTNRAARFVIGQLRFSTTETRKRIFRRDRQMWHRVESVATESFNGEVWDMEVADDHSFRAYGANVHNCSCPWASYSWGRSGRWKKYEGRVCSHVLALMYEAQHDNSPVPKADWDTDPITHYTPPPQKEWRTAQLEDELFFEGGEINVRAGREDGLDDYETGMSGAGREALGYSTGGLYEEELAFEPLEVIASTPADVKEAVHLWSSIKVNNQLSLPDPLHDGFRYAFHEVMGDQALYRQDAGPEFVKGEQLAILFLRTLMATATPTSHVLYRAIGLDDTKYAAMTQEASTKLSLDLPPASWTAQKTQTEQFGVTYTAGSETYPHRIIFKTRPGASSWALGRTSMTGYEKEHVIGGRFVVTSIEFPKDGSNVTTIHLQQVDPFPDDIHVSGDLLDHIVFDQSAELTVKTAARTLAEYTGGGTMIAVAPPVVIGERLAVEGGEDDEEMHVTLAYIKSGVEFDPAVLLDLVTDLADSYGPPIEATIAGYGQFKNGDEDVLFAIPSSDRLWILHQKVIDALDAAGIEYSRDNAWQPHITLAYGDFDIPDHLPGGIDGETFEFHSLIIGNKDGWQFFPFGGPDLSVESRYLTEDEARAGRIANFSEEYVRTGKPTEDDIHELMYNYFLMHGKYPTPEQESKLRAKMAGLPVAGATYYHRSSPGDRASIQATGKGFLTKEPSHRARVVMDRINGTMTAALFPSMSDGDPDDGEMSENKPQEPAKKQESGGKIGTLNDEPEPALPSTDGGDDDLVDDDAFGESTGNGVGNFGGSLVAAQDPYTPQPWAVDETDQQRSDIFGDDIQKAQGIGDMSSTSGLADEGDDEDQNSGDEIFGDNITDASGMGGSSSTAQLTGPSWLDPANGGGGSGGGDMDIAEGARQYLAHKSFNRAEQEALINEGEDSIAANLGSLDLEGTHYQELEAAMAAADSVGEAVIWW